MDAKPEGFRLLTVLALPKWSPIKVLNNLIAAYHIYPTPSLGQDMTQGQLLSEV